MEDMDSFWSYQEIIGELKQKLLYTTLELESVRVEANEGMRKNKEYVQQLVQFLKIACQERDEARDQLQKLLNKIMPSTTRNEFFTTLHQLPRESPIAKPTKANSSITESNSFSETYNYHSNSSSPVDSFFDPVSSPELNIGDSSNITFANQPFVQDYTGTVSASLPKIDQASFVIDNLLEKKTLPKKGKLLQAVLDAGPLLQTLLVAGPLPRWRNPPPLQPLHIPLVGIKGLEDEIVTQKPA